MVLEIVAAVRGDDVGAGSHHIGLDALVDRGAYRRGAGALAVVPHVVDAMGAEVGVDVLAIGGRAYADGCRRTGGRTDAMAILAGSKAGVGGIGDEGATALVETGVGALAHNLDRQQAPVGLAQSDIHHRVGSLVGRRIGACHDAHAAPLLEAQRVGSHLARSDEQRVAGIAVGHQAHLETPVATNHERHTVAL